MIDVATHMLGDTRADDYPPPMPLPTRGPCMCGRYDELPQTDEFITIVEQDGGQHSQLFCHPRRSVFDE